MLFQNRAQFFRAQFPPQCHGLIFRQRLQIGSDFRRDIVHLVRRQHHFYGVNIPVQQFLIRQFPLHASILSAAGGTSDSFSIAPLMFRHSSRSDSSTDWPSSERV